MPDGPATGAHPGHKAMEVTHECRRKPAADEDARRRVERSELGGVSEAALNGHEGVLARSAGSDPGRDAHHAESEAFFKSIENHLDNNSCRVMFGSGDWTCTI